MATRTAAAASAKAPRIDPITDALMPRSNPSTGTTNVCTSQQDDKNQFTSIKRRNIGSRSRSQAFGRAPASVTSTGGSSRVERTRNQLPKGSSASRKKATRYPGRLLGELPAWSINSPAAKGPRKLENAGPMESQLNTCRSCTGPLAARPTCRCKAITAVPVAPPVNSADRHNTGNTGKATAAPAPVIAASTLYLTGRFSPWRSAKRPAGSARNTCVNANSASNKPTAAGL